MLFGKEKIRQFIAEDFFSAKLAETKPGGLS
jgi:hypothetical protein